MKGLTIIAIALLGVVGVNHAALAHDHGHSHASFLFSFGCCSTYPYAYSQPYYEYPQYYAAPAPYYVSPPVVYVEPQPLGAFQTSQTFIDGYGRSCRTFQSSINGGVVTGTACLQPDGTWRTVAE